MQEGEPSYKLYAEEKESLLASLKRRASQLYKALNELEGVTCNEPEGALYCMPRVRLSKKVLQVCLPPPCTRARCLSPAFSTSGPWDWSSSGS